LRDNEIKINESNISPIKDREQPIMFSSETETDLGNEQ
jgi:hypothetical protein